MLKTRKIQITIMFTIIKHLSFYSIVSRALKPPGYLIDTSRNLYDTFAGVVHKVYSCCVFLFFNLFGKENKQFSGENVDQSASPCMNLRRCGCCPS